MFRRGLPVLYLLIAMLSIQSGASFAKTLFPATGAVGLTFLRIAFAAVILMAIWRPWRSCSKNELKKLFAYGLVLGLMNVTFYLAVKRIPLGVAVALEFIGPLAVTICLSRRPLDFLWVALAAVGVAVLLIPSRTHAALDGVGVIFGLAAAVFWGLYILLGKRAGSGVHSGHAAAWGMTFAAITVLPVAVLSQDHRFLTPTLWPAALVVAIFSSALPYSLEMLALKNLTPMKFGLLLSLEPALAALVAMAILGEQLTFVQWLAIGCVVAASVGSTFSYPLPPAPDTPA
jgi:inner membrane transporter RhtA